MRCLTRELARRLHRELTDEVAKGEALATECAELAHLNEQRGNRTFAQVLRGLGRSHRIRQLETDSKLALLQDGYGHLLTFH